MKRNMEFSNYLENNAGRVYEMCKKELRRHLNEQVLNILESSLPGALRTLGEYYERQIYEMRKMGITNASEPYSGGSAIVKIPTIETPRYVLVCHIYMTFLDWSFIKSTGAKDEDFNEFLDIGVSYYSHSHEEDLQPGVPIISCKILHLDNAQRDGHFLYYKNLKYKRTRKAIQYTVGDPYIKKYIKSKEFISKKVGSIFEKKYLYFKDFVLSWEYTSELGVFDDVQYVLIPREGKEVIVLDVEESRCLEPVVIGSIRQDEHKNTTIRDLLKKYLDRIIREGGKC